MRWPVSCVHRYVIPFADDIPDHDRRVIDAREAGKNTAESARLQADVSLPLRHDYPMGCSDRRTSPVQVVFRHGA